MHDILYGLAFAIPTVLYTYLFGYLIMWFFKLKCRFKFPMLVEMLPPVIMATSFVFGIDMITKSDTTYPICSILLYGFVLAVIIVAIILTVLTRLRNLIPER